ncbi:IS1249 family transposase [Trueperella sp. LYQ143]|uniref:IS1249 family transposase n=1 Tax=unclassified Trueperella TaxID=2630174 RepID=UPI003983980B
MTSVKCPGCGRVMSRHGKTSAGSQRWWCRSCGMTRVHHIDATAKHLCEFLGWLLSNKRQVDMPGQGRSFRRRCAPLWKLWPFAPVVDEVHEVVFVDGIHLGRKAVVLIAQSRTHVLGWYVARRENSRAWAALLERIPAPDLVISDGAGGFEKARRQVWPTTKVQRCTFHVFAMIKRATTTRPKLPASQQLYRLGLKLLRVKTSEEAREWLCEYNQWHTDWEEFLDEKTPTPNGGWVYTHQRLVRARNSLNQLIRRDLLFTFVDPCWQEPMPATNNRIEGATNAPLRQVLRNHRGMNLTRRIKAIFWWCYMHTENPLPASQILKIMPTDKDIENAWQQAAQHQQANTTIPTWGDAICWNELHHTTPYHNTWD